MADPQVQDAYARRAAEYTSLLGAVDQLSHLDRGRIERWAQDIAGPVLDAGCGPGQWTNLLHQLGLQVQGVDLVPQFIESARTRFPDVPFRVASLRGLEMPDGALGGVLAWYSLIHFDPDELPGVLSELARVLAPGGRLLIGYFEGAAAEPFPHAVTTAYHWSVERMGGLLDDAGFRVLDVETRQDPGSRPHAAIEAILR